MTFAIPTLETERLLLRPWRDADTDGFASLMGDAVHSRFVGGPLSREEAWRKMCTYVGHWFLRGYGPFALEAKATGQFVGYCGPWAPLGWPEPEISWGIVPSAARQGFATEAATRALTYAYETLKWPTAVSVIAVENSASIRVAERLGAVLGRTTENRGWTVGIYRHRAPTV
jgi:RimJ/RimL family protein N-acetyltransferase